MRRFALVMALASLGLFGGNGEAVILVREETTPEDDPGGPCDPIEDPDSRKPSCAQLRTGSTGHFHSLTVVEGAGINGGDVAGGHEGRDAGCDCAGGRRS